MIKFSLFFLFLLLPVTAFAVNHHRQLRPPRPPPPPPPPSVPPPPLHQHQVNNIIDALIGAGDFNNWANMLSASHLFMLPLSATLFVPSDDSLFPFPFSASFPTSTAAAVTSVDPLIIPYHIVPQRLTFSQLALFKPFSRLPTLLPSKSILVTNTSPSNFTVDASHISHPDLYLTSSIAVHGISSLFNYTVYGGDAGLDYGITPPLPPAQPPPPPPRMFEPLGDVMDDRRKSDAGCLYWEFAFVSLLIPWMVLNIKIYGYRLGIRWVLLNTCDF
ncbi:Splicing factor 3B subunit 5/RDS3 complex subunit 10 [Hibiscus syriacus]|uniref:Splicing factor 3B subunit 5/RDS3 complex subunit 10 n=1 Tax=Hibiscus syriacus TaxID=106335 RepID=A0A6A2YIU0_HIBSY|nr:Splicing factor 3B subunit 5/RDS3 complex subunit 10 [Hibiscus syriacus]